MKGQTALVTGASSGIGLATARALAGMGAHVILVCRDQKRGDEALRAVRQAVPDGSAELCLADLSSQASIRALAADVLERHAKLHVLVNNAGAVNARRELTVDGLEKTFATNHLGYFLLTNLLLDRLKASAPSRVISVASRVDAGGRLNFDDLMGEKYYLGSLAYARSKLANVAFTFELSRRLEGTNVTAFAVHPGSVATNFGMVGGGFLGFMAKLVRVFQVSPERGADTVIWLASSPEALALGGQYVLRRRRVRGNRQAYQPEVQRRLWEVSESLCGLSPRHGADVRP